MTTADLLDIIARVEADRKGRRPDADWPGQEDWPAITLDTLSHRARCTRRSVEEAIQTARLEGVPVITDGGIRVATTAAEAFALHRWLRHRLATQNRTAWAVRCQAMVMDRAERAEASRAVPRAPAATEQATLGLDVAA